jgi:hypothetical protein
MWIMVEPVAEIPFRIRRSPTRCYGCNNVAVTGCMGVIGCDMAACNVGRGGSGGGSGGAWARGGRDGVVSHFFCAVDGCSPTVLVGGAGMIDSDVAIDVGFPGGSTGAWGVAGA